MIRVEHGDCLAVLPALAAEGVLVDSVVCDPPYHLTSMSKPRPDLAGKDNQFARRQAQMPSAGFMGKEWDGGDIAFRPETWAAVMAVMKPGAHLIAFSGSRTYHRMACAIEDAGFEIRDQLMWLYGSGFAKSRRVNLDPMFCQCGAVERSGGCITPEHKTGDHKRMAALSVCDGVRSSSAQDLTHTEQDSLADCLPGRGLGDAQPRDFEARDQVSAPSQRCVPEHSRSSECEDVLQPVSSDSLSPVQCKTRLSSTDYLPLSVKYAAPFDTQASHKLPSDKSGTADRTLGSSDIVPLDDYGCGFPRCQVCGKPVADGIGSALKPAHEPIVLARKPLAKGHTIAANVLAHGVGGLNIDGCRVGTDGPRPLIERHDQYRPQNVDLPSGSRAAGDTTLGRWPANLIHDGSDEIVAAFPSERPGGRPVTGRGDSAPIWGNAGHQDFAGYADSGSAARFFYSSKADADDRCGSKHPTVKPTDLMAYLCRLVTPPGGLVLDPFAGSGSTGMACLREGFDAILIEREAEYVSDIRRRVAHVSGQDSPLFEVAA